MPIELNIPFATNELGEELSIMFASNRPDHVYITGSAGSGKQICYTRLFMLLYIILMETMCCRK